MRSKIMCVRELVHVCVCVCMYVRERERSIREYVRRRHTHQPIWQPHFGQTRANDGKEAREWPQFRQKNARDLDVTLGLSRCDADEGGRDATDGEEGDWFRDGVTVFRISKVGVEENCDESFERVGGGFRE